MSEMTVAVERVTEEAQVALRCACGGCHPTATIYRDDPRYEWHDPRLAEGPCCCGRFFAVGDTLETARARAEALAEQPRGEGVAPDGYDFRTRRVPLPWGGEVAAVVADVRGGRRDAGA